MVEKNENVVLRRVGHVLFLIDTKKSYNSEKEDLLQIDEIGEIIWNAVCTGDELEHILERVLKEFIDEKTESFVEMVKGDVFDFLMILKHNGMVKGDFVYD